MKKMEELIKSMNEEGINTGVVTAWYTEFADNCEKCANFVCNGQSYIDSGAYRTLDELYNKIIGFLWGLASLNYITEETRESCVRELIAMMRF